MLIDDLMSLGSKALHKKQSSLVIDRLRQATVFRIHNAAEHVFQKPLTDWNVKEDFPNIAPPFQTMWMEWMQRADWLLGPDENTNMPGKFRAGVLICAEDARSRSVRERLKKINTKLTDDTRWYCQAIPFFDLHDGCNQLHGIAWLINNDGRLPLDLSFGVEPCPKEMRHQHSLKEALDCSLAPIAICFMALSLLHCKNVVVRKSLSLPPKLQKSRLRKGKMPLVRWNTIVIDPSKMRLSSMRNGAAGTGLKGMHRCRGHFKDFTGRGLFGRLHGVYWWPMHVRGSAERGVVSTDYLVKTQQAHLGREG